MVKALKKSFNIGNRVIGEECSPYVIAEMSANHNGNIENAFNIIKAAKQSGADAVKLQTYRPDTITINSRNPEFILSDGLWSGQSLFELYEKAHMPWEWHKPLFDYAKDVGITIFSSPFDKTAVDLLEDLDCPAYKIASFEIVDHALIKYAAETGKPIIISTGMATLEEITEAVAVVEGVGCSQLALLHCVSGYPSAPEDYNLLTIKGLVGKFDCLVGVSDHTISNVTANAAVALGACIVEKHFTLDRSGGGPDDSFSMEPSDLKDLCHSVKATYLAVGTENYKLLSAEKSSSKLRRSLYFVKQLKAGDLVTADSIRSIRPGNGISPKHFNALVGMELNRDVEFGTATDWNFFKAGSKL